MEKVLSLSGGAFTQLPAGGTSCVLYTSVIWHGLARLIPDQREPTWCSCDTPSPNGMRGGGIRAGYVSLPVSLH